MNNSRSIWLSFTVLMVIVSVPVFSTVLPPILDYPNHFARLHLVAEGGNRFYAVRWAPLPNLALDLIVPALGKLMPLALAMKLFLVLSFALLTGGTLWLNRAATGCWRWWGLLSFLLPYDRILLWGFLNYLFGLGVVLCGLAFWLSLEHRPGWRVAASSLIALGCFFSHIEALGIYALAILGVELPPMLALLRAHRLRALATRIAVAAVQFVAPAILFLSCLPPSEGGAVSYGNFARKVDLLFSVFDNYNRPFDVACFALFVALFVGLAWRRRLWMGPRIGMALAILAVAYLLLPSQLMSGSGVDRRIPVALFLLLVAGTAPIVPLPRRVALGIQIGVAVIFLARMAMIEAVWLQADRLYAAGIAVIDTLPVGAKLAVAYPSRDVNAGAIPELHVATLAVIRREAFVPTIFAYRTQQPLALRPPYDALAATTSPTDLWDGFVDGDEAVRKAATSVLRDYNFVAFADRETFTVPDNICLEPRAATPRFHLFALRHGQRC
ncbi:MAG TPA: hypothetical protein VM782_01540 [Stellaceae bacterium]|nr:hypothetical protein [Stellaceae bacterium]